MAASKISALTALAAPTSDDILAIVDDPLGTPTTKKITVDNLLAYNKQQKRVTVDRTFSSVTLAAIPDLDSFTLAPNTVYRFHAALFCTSNALTVGMHHGVNFTGTVTYIRAGEVVNPVTAPTAAGSAVAFGVATAANTKIIATTAGPGAVSTLIVIEGIIEVGASGGTFSFQAASETATVTTVERGSWATVEVIP